MNRSLQITGSRPLSEAFLNSYFRMLSAEQMFAFEDLFIELSPKLKAVGMNSEEFMNHIRQSYQRYQEHKRLDPFLPMDKKAQKYVEDFMRESVDKMYDAFMKSKRK